MDQPLTIQEILFQSVKGKLAPNISFVHDLSELLGISYDSAYRRIRGEKELSLEELKTICIHYEISADALFNLKSNHVIFNSLAIGEDGFDIEKWLRSILKAIRQVHDAKEKEIIYAAKDIPVFYFFEFPEIAAFKIYFWNKALIPASGYENKKLTLEPPEELYETGRQLLSHYIKIPAIEIWSEETISSILRQIDYCFVSGFFSRTEDVYSLCDTLETWLNHVQSQAELGLQYMFGTTPDGIENSFKLYHNEVLVTDNTILVKTNGQKKSFNTYNVINQLITSNPVFCDQVENSLRNLMQKSTMISGTSAKERYRFFNILHEKVNTLRNRIERMS
ncbi:MAG: helix-turn-helix domain-containing protein [Bacteroidales bacterium]|nr:helix-turn-helix domain-containing protein [Bacteroidales bacterium]